MPSVLKSGYPLTQFFNDHIVVEDILVRQYDIRRIGLSEPAHVYVVVRHKLYKPLDAYCRH